MTQQLVALELVAPNPYQPRTSEDVEHIQNLALSIGRDGLLQPPAARAVDGGYQLAFGHSRFKAICFLHTTLQSDPHWFDDHGLDQNQDFSAIALEIVALDDEAMYRHAISENMQRKDLTPIEEARAMKRAMEEFKYTSAQVGALFGKAEGTVRGKIRLLDLPEAVQARLSYGELSEGTARTLLTAKKALGGDELEALAGQVAEFKNPEMVLQKVKSALNDNKNSVLMFDANWQKSEPSGGSDLWPLGWTFFEMPLEAQAIKSWNGPKEIDTVIDGYRNITPIRQVFHQTALALESKNPEKWEQLIAERPERREAIEHLRTLANPPACTACPAYIKLEGLHYCGNKTCWKRKKEMWISEQFKAFAAESSIPPLEEGETFIRADDWDDREQYKKLYAEKAEGLRLKKAFSEYQPHTITGSKFATLVDVSPERIAAKEAKNQCNEQSERELEYERRNRRRDASNAFILERAYLIFMQAFAGLDNIGAMMSLTGTNNERKLDGGTLFADLPRAKKLDVLRLAVTRHALGNAIPWQLILEGPSAVANHLTGLATSWGIQLPADWMDTAQGYEPFPNETGSAPGAESAPDEDEEMEAVL